MQVDPRNNKRDITNYSRRCFWIALLVEALHEYLFSSKWRSCVDGFVFSSVFGDEVEKRAKSQVVDDLGGAQTAEPHEQPQQAPTCPYT